MKNIFLRRITVIAFFITVVVSLLAGCGRDREPVSQLDRQAAEEALSKAEIPYRQVLQLVQVPETQNGLALAFYELPQGLKAALLEKDASGWTLVDSDSAQSPSLKPEQGLSWAYSDLGTKEMSFPLYYGVIANPEISQVQMELAGGKRPARKLLTPIHLTKGFGSFYPKGQKSLR